LFSNSGAATIASRSANVRGSRFTQFDHLAFEPGQLGSDCRGAGASWCCASLHRHSRRHQSCGFGTKRRVCFDECPQTPLTRQVAANESAD
jgi:hypothetical protein